MKTEILILCLAAASIGFVHTVLGPDHYLPFIVMSRARRWSVLKTGLVTVFCGLGHVLSSIILGLIGIACGISVMRLEAFEIFRGNVAAWLLIGFGCAYFIWGIHRAIKNKPHGHYHVHKDETFHSHDHLHSREHAHVHESEGKNLTPWILFTIFVLGPCEPLIPLLMYPAAKHSVSGMLLVTAVFSVVTILTMLAVVVVSAWGVSFARLEKTERYAHAIAGCAILVSGLAVRFLGL